MRIYEIELGIKRPVSNDEHRFLVQVHERGSVLEKNLSDHQRYLANHLVIQQILKKETKNNNIEYSFNKR